MVIIAAFVFPYSIACGRLERSPINGAVVFVFLVWFGRRELASIVFAVIVLNKHLPGGGTISMTVVCTILMSIIAHGLSANPFVAALAARIKCSAEKTMVN